jgi:hypothetical protein
VFDEPMMFDDPVFGESGVVAAVEVYVDPPTAAALTLAALTLAAAQIKDVGSAAALLAAGAAHALPAGGLGLGAAARALLNLPTAAARALLNLPAAAAGALLNLSTAALLAALLLGQSTCCRAGHGNRRSRQSNRYLTYHGALHP